jgi:hypothetical protein
MIPHFFEKKSDLRKWFIKHHEDETELLVGFYKVATGKPPSANARKKNQPFTLTKKKRWISQNPMSSNLRPINPHGNFLSYRRHGTAK